MLRWMVVLSGAMLVSAAPHQQQGEAERGSPSAGRVNATARPHLKADFIDAATLNDAGDLAKQYQSMGRTVFTAPDEQTTYLLVRRTASSEVETHARWDDLLIARSGVGVLVLGDSVVGAELRAPGELRGGRTHVTGQLVVHPGDVIRVPATMPHSFVIGGSAPFEYLLVKIRRQELPIRWFHSSNIR